MALFKKREIKKFDYQPRYYKNESGTSPYEMKHKFDEFRKTTGAQPGLKGKFNNAMDELKDSDAKVNKNVIIIAMILILIFLYIIDFDLSIFFK